MMAFYWRSTPRTGTRFGLSRSADPKEGYFISMPPLVHGDLIYIGPAGAETAARGWVGAFRIRDGEQVWRFNIVPDDGEPVSRHLGAGFGRTQTRRRQSVDSDVL